MNANERLYHYNAKKYNGNGLEQTFRFRGKPNSEFRQIYKEYDSLLNHHSRLIRNTKRFLDGVLPPEEIKEIQIILSSHDVPELVEGDVSRLIEDAPVETKKNVIDLLLLADDAPRYRDFETAQHFLEQDHDQLPDNPLSFVARILDTVDGNCFACEILENYAIKIGPAKSKELETALNRTQKYINKIREKYRDRIDSLKDKGYYQLDISPLLTHLQTIEMEKINKSLSIIKNAGYEIIEII